MCWKKEKVNLRLLDYCLWLNQPVYARIPRDVLHKMYDEAVRYGSVTAEKYPIEQEGMFEDQFRKYGVADIRTFLQPNLFNVGEKGFYLPSEKIIYYNASFAAMLLQTGSEANICGNEEEIRRAILLHELFHHIEEHLEKPTHQYLRQQYKLHAGSIFREIAAFTFANVQMMDFICQMIDVMWLKAFAPKQYEILCTTYFTVEENEEFYPES